MSEVCVLVTERVKANVRGFRCLLTLITGLLLNSCLFPMKGKKRQAVKKERSERWKKIKAR